VSDAYSGPGQISCSLLFILLFPDGLANTLHEEVANEMGVPFVPEFFADIEWVDGGIHYSAEQSTDSMYHHCTATRKTANFFPPPSRKRQAQTSVLIE
jgi:hypothetical protein